MLSGRSDAANWTENIVDGTETFVDILESQSLPELFVWFFWVRSCLYVKSDSVPICTELFVWCLLFCNVCLAYWISNQIRRTF
jgi:hypothetical protein